MATVTLCRPDRLNSQTPLTWRALAQAGSALPGSVRVVVVRGEGRSFSAGLDRAMFTPGGIPGVPSPVELVSWAPEEADRELAGYQAAFGWLSRPDIISIAAVQGHAVGAGFQLALACDLRIAAEDVQLTMAEVALGLVPDLGGTRRLAGLVGYSRALEICLSTRRVGAQEAVAIGLVNRVVASAELDAAVDATVQGLLGQPREAVIEAKALLLSTSLHTQAEQEIAERTAQLRLLAALAGVARD